MCVCVYVYIYTHTHTHIHDKISVSHCNLRYKNHFVAMQIGNAEQLVTMQPCNN